MMRNNFAVFTLCSADDEHRLKYWEKYYSRFFKDADRYVLRHCMIPTDVIWYPNIISLMHSKAYDHPWMHSTVTAFHHFLLRTYTRVLFVEVDEFLVPNPLKFQGLGDFLSRRLNFRPQGYEILHGREEAPLLWDHDWLCQRNYWHKSEMYSKPIITTETPTWSLGFHAVSGPELPIDEDIALLHTHRIDADETFARHQLAVSKPWPQQEIDSGHGIQSRLSTREECEAFCSGELCPTEQLNPLFVPVEYRNLQFP